VDTKNCASIRSGSSYFKILGLPEEEFPSLTRFEDAKIFTKWCARCRADPDRLPPRPARVRVSEPALGPGRPAPRATARHAAEAWIASVHPLRGPELRLAPTAAGLPGHRLRIRERAQGAALRRCGAQDHRSSRTRGRHRVPGPSAHAAPRHRLRAG